MASMVQALEIGDTVGFCFEFKETVIKSGKKGDQSPRKTGNRVQGKGIGQLAGSDPEFPLRSALHR